MAADLAELLGAAWDAFSVLLAGCQDAEDRSAELFAAFAFAAAAAVQGRLIIDSAPSLPAGLRVVTSGVAAVNADPEQIADDLAGLAEALSVRLSAAARAAGDGGDRDGVRGSGREGGADR
jgi:hypothetical protein